MDQRKCSKCGLRVSAGVCDTPPLVFHDRPEQCIGALVAERARLMRALSDAGVREGVTARFTAREGPGHARKERK